MGAHRTGKTTLARAFAEKHNMTFVETSAGQVFKDMGLDPAVTYDFSTRLTVQEEILKRFDKQYAGHPKFGEAIADRTPLDMLAYTMAEADGNVVSDEDQNRFREYSQKCFDVTNKRFAVLLVVQPGIDVIKAEGKAALNEAYIEHLNSLILGLSVDHRVDAAHFYVPRYMTDLSARIASLEFAVGKAVQRAQREHEGAVIH